MTYLRDTTSLKRRGIMAPRGDPAASALPLLLACCAACCLATHMKDFRQVLPQLGAINRAEWCQKTVTVASGLPSGCAALCYTMKERESRRCTAFAVVPEHKLCTMSYKCAFEAALMPAQVHYSTLYVSTTRTSLYIYVSSFIFRLFFLVAAFVGRDNTKKGGRWLT